MISGTIPLTKLILFPHVMHFSCFVFVIIIIDSFPCLFLLSISKGCRMRVTLFDCLLLVLHVYGFIYHVAQKNFVCIHGSNIYKYFLFFFQGRWLVTQSTPPGSDPACIAKMAGVQRGGGGRGVSPYRVPNLNLTKRKFHFHNFLQWINWLLHVLRMYTRSIPGCDLTHYDLQGKYYFRD